MERAASSSLSSSSSSSSRLLLRQRKPLMQRQKGSRRASTCTLTTLTGFAGGSASTSRRVVFSSRNTKCRASPPRPEGEDGRSARRSGNYNSGSGNGNNVAYERDTFRRSRTPDSFRGDGSNYGEDNNYSSEMASTSKPNSWWSGEEMGGVTKALLAGSFVFGIAFGAWLNGEANFQPNNVASTEIVDRKTPSGAVCMANGYSSMVFDQRVFVSFNPFNVYVTSPEVKPGCVLRQANVQELERRQLVTRSEADTCRKGMNTFAYVGALDEKPEVSCVYHSEEAENQFMVDPKRSNLGDGVSLPPGEQPAFAGGTFE